MRSLFLLVFVFLALLADVAMCAFTVKTIYDLLACPAFAVGNLTLSQALAVAFLTKYAISKTQKVEYEKGNDVALIIYGLYLNAVNSLMFIVLAHFVKSLV